MDRDNKRKYKVGSPEFLEEAKRLGLTGYQYMRKLVEEGVLPDPTKIKREEKDEFNKRHKFKNDSEYIDFLSQKRGYKNANEYKKEWSWNKGITSPMSENEDCPYYLGVHIAEKYYAIKILQLKFGGIEKDMPPKNPGFDIIAKGGHRIDSKARVISQDYRWVFPMIYNNITDYFLLLAFIDVHDSPVHSWLIHKDEIIRGRKLWRRNSLAIINKPEYLSQFMNYDLEKELEKIIGEEKDKGEK